MIEDIEFHQRGSGYDQNYVNLNCGLAWVNWCRVRDDSAGKDCRSLETEKEESVPSLILQIRKISKTFRENF